MRLQQVRTYVRRVRQIVSQKAEAIIEFLPEPSSLKNIVTDPRFGTMFIVRIIMVVILGIALLLSRLAFNAIFHKEGYARDTNEKRRKFLFVYSILFALSFAVVLFLLFVGVLALGWFSPTVLSGLFASSEFIYETLIFEMFVIWLVLVLLSFAVMFSMYKNRTYFKFPRDTISMVISLEKYTFTLAVVCMVLPIYLLR
jgi:hypothetical protein